jgi:hypothetical protein
MQGIKFLTSPHVEGLHVMLTFAEWLSVACSLYTQTSTHTPTIIRGVKKAMASEVTQIIQKIMEMLPTLVEEFLKENFKKTSELLEEIDHVEEGMSNHAIRLSDYLDGVEYLEEGIRIHENNPTLYSWEVRDKFQDDLKVLKNDIQEGIINMLTERNSLKKHKAELKKLRDEFSMLNERMIVVEYFKEFMKNL